MTGGSVGGSDHRFKVCIFCDKNFTADEDEDDSKLPFSKEETSLLVDEEGYLSCGLHRGDELCHDCFQDVVIEGHLALADHLEHHAFRDTMDSAVKRMWKDIYLKEGDKVPWSDDEDKEVKLPSSSPRDNSKKCAHCGKGGDLERCSKCKVVLYCSKSHQAADYAKHKASCQAPKAPKAPVNDTAQATQVRQDEKPSNDSKQPLQSSYRSCTHCGKTNNLSMCTRCKATYYCSKDHQRADYPKHKPECKMVADLAEIHEHRPDMKSIWMHKPPRGFEAAQPAQMPVITWSELQKMRPNVATGRTLEVTIISEPSSKIFAPQCDGRDVEGTVMRVALVTHRPPQGFRKGCILRWRNPWFHIFLDGTTGASIENWDLPNVSVE